MYRINNVEYSLKEKYTLKDWGRILNLLSGLNLQNENSISLLLTDNRVENLLAIIFDKPIEGEIFEDDFEEVSRAINDFFTRKKSLIRNTKSSLVN